jgi:hypothetical protein
MNKKYLDNLYLLRYAYDTLELLDWEFDIKEQVKDVFGRYKEKYVSQSIERKDLKSLENYVICINTFDKNKLYKKNLRILG